MSIPPFIIDVFRRWVMDRRHQQRPPDAEGYASSSATFDICRLIAGVIATQPSLRPVVTWWYRQPAFYAIFTSTRHLTPSNWRPAPIRIEMRSCDGTASQPGRTYGKAQDRVVSSVLALGLTRRHLTTDSQLKDYLIAWRAISWPSLILLEPPPPSAAAAAAGGDAVSAWQRCQMTDTDTNPASTHLLLNL